jgi:hypothetical protein
MEQQELLERVEQAEREAQFCAFCGAPTVVAARGEALWLECSAVEVTTSFVRRLLTSDWPSLHARRRIVTIADVAA